MNLLDQKMKRYSIIFAGLMVCFLVGYLVTPYKPHSLGLFVGLLFSFISLWTTYRKAKVVGQVGVDMRKFSIFSYIISVFGFVIRIGLALVAVWFAVRNPEKLDVISVITGFALIYVIIMTDMLVQFCRKR